MGRERTVLVRKVSLAGTLVLLSAAALLVYLHKPSPRTGIRRFRDLPEPGMVESGSRDLLPHVARLGGIVVRHLS